MKLQLEVELDWIDDSMNLDDTIKQNIIDTISSRIQTKIEEQVTKKVTGVIDEVIVSKINELTEGLFADFLNRKVTITDGYGSSIKVYDNVEAIVKEKFDRFLLEKVDDQGKESTYNAKHPRLHFIINKQLTDFSNKFTADAVAKVSAEIKKHVSDGLTTKLGAELMNVLKVNEMLQLPAGKQN